MSLYLAVDAGGTKADFLLADESRELARVRTGTIKRMRADAVTATANLDEGLRSLTRQAGISMNSISCSCVGTAGETVPLVTDWLREEFKSRVSGKLMILGDVEIALDAAFPGKAGVLVLAGTGSNVAGRDQKGRLTSAGGWGPALADQGSGHKIGQEALRSVFASIDEDIPTTLLSAVLKSWSLTTVEQIVEVANRIPSPDFSRLTPLVLQCAHEGDAVASRVLQREGKDLAALAVIVIRRLQASASDSGWVPDLAFAGSIMERVPPVRQALIGEVIRTFPAIRAVEGVVDPIHGALWRARNDRHIQATDHSAPEETPDGL